MDTGKDIRNYNYMCADIELLKNKVLAYYNENGSAPITGTAFNAKSTIGSQASSRDNDNYYAIDLNKLYKKDPALYQNEVNWEGFNWLMVNDADHNVLAYKRIDNKGESLDVIINFAYCDWNDYIMPFDNGEYEVVLASSDKIYGGYTNLKKTTYQVKDGCLRIKLYNSTGIILRKVKNYV